MSSEQSQETGLTVKDQSEQKNIAALTSLADRIGAASATYACNFPADPKKAYTLASQCTNGEAFAIADLVGETIQPVYWFVHHVPLPDIRTGEVSDVCRVVFIDNQGQAYSATSQGIFDALKQLVTSLGAGPLPRDLRIRFTQSKTRSGWQLLSFVPVWEGE